MRWWLENDLPHSPQKMGEIFTEMIIKPTWLVMTQADSLPGKKT
jgi:hypothetical protein